MAYLFEDNLFSISFNFLSFLALLLATTAQIAAGNQPIRDTCRNTHKIPANILPLRKKDNQGIRIANKIIRFVKSTNKYK